MSIEGQFSGVRVRGVSQAGTGTCFYLPEYRVCLDVAQGHLWSVSAEAFLITHAHMDHAGGIPYVISQRALNNLGTARFFMPPTMVEPLRKIMDQWQTLEGFPYKFEFNAVTPGLRFELRPHLFAEPFTTVHRVPSQGYFLQLRKKHLKEEFQKVEPSALGALRRSGQEVDEIHYEDFFAFTGDTQIEALDLNPRLLKVPLLFIEVTYLDSRKSRQSAREWGHIHLDEIIDRVDSFQNENVVLVHTSRRYSREEAKKILYSRLPPKQHHQFSLFGM